MNPVEARGASAKLKCVAGLNCAENPKRYPPVDAPIRERNAIEEAECSDVEDIPVLRCREGLKRCPPQRRRAVGIFVQDDGEQSTGLKSGRRGDLTLYKRTGIVSYHAGRWRRRNRCMGERAWCVSWIPHWKRLMLMDSFCTPNHWGFAQLLLEGSFIGKECCLGMEVEGVFEESLILLGMNCLRAADCDLAEWNFSTTELTASPNSPVWEMGASRRKTFSFSRISVRLIPAATGYQLPAPDRVCGVLSQWPCAAPWPPQESDQPLQQSPWGHPPGSLEGWQ